ncbi:MAG TPA: maleylpyruvate isomerase N-terminal domain-containing protein [Acetobacteraceae bacterium]|jgi:uncharacterized protein (TIGR03083 family)
MLPIAIDFRTEVTTLHDLLTPRPPSDYTRPTLFKQWTIDDILLHLHDSDLAAASIAGARAFSAFRADRQTLLDRGMTRSEAARHKLSDLSGPNLLAAWHAQAITLAGELDVLPPGARLPWFGPDIPHVHDRAPDGDLGAWPGDLVRTSTDDVDRRLTHRRKVTIRSRVTVPGQGHSAGRWSSFRTAESELKVCRDCQSGPTACSNRTASRKRFHSVYAMNMLALSA